MGFLDNFLGKMNFNGDDDEVDYDEENDKEETNEEEDGEDEDAVKEAAKPEHKKAEPAEEEEKAPASKRSFVKSSSASKVVPMRTSDLKASEVCMIMPKGYENSSEIAETLLQGKTVVLNLEGMDVGSAQRIIDFTSGACFTMGGNLQKISKKIFIATPSSVELTGDFVNMIEDVDMNSLNLSL